MRKALLSVFILSAFLLNAQDWVEGMRDHAVNFYTVQNQFEIYWQQVEAEAKRTNQLYRPGKTGPAYGWPQFRRWEYFWEPRVSATDGMRPAPDVLAQTSYAAYQVAASQSSGDWTPIGPFDAPNSNSWTGIGRVNCIAFNPNNNNEVWIGAPAGGLWKSTNGGQTWATNTDLLPNLGVSSIAIDPQHPDTMYIATGDRDGADTYSYGILKSTDGGQTWNTTGLSFGVSQARRIGALHIVPNNTQIIIAATRIGMFRSTDGGQTFSTVQSGSFNMLAPDPQNPHIIFAGTGGAIGRVWRSKDSGATWTQLTNGMPANGTNRVEISVSPQDSNYVYAVFSLTNNGFGGLYRSTDGGDTWSMRSTSPNILGWSASGSGTGGQGWYDLAIAVNPINKNQIFVGGVNLWSSTSGGTNWTCVGHWYGQNGVPIVHADIHYLKFQPGTSDLYIATDGGLYETTNLGNNYIPYKDGINITQYYKISQSPSNASLIMGGAQDNGTHLQNNTTWNIVRGGDGMDNAIDPDNNSIMYASVYYGDFTKSTNGGSSFFSMNSLTAAGSGNWVTPFVIDPTNSSILYAGFDRLWRSTNKGSSWSATSSLPINGTNIDDIAVAPSNNQVLYVAINEDIYRSTNNGSNWADISQNLPGSSHITGITVSPTNASHIWVTRSGYAASQKVFESNDGGQTWINQTGSLPNLPVNCVIYEENSLDGIYVGTDVGVYYRDATMTDWVPYMSGLPNVIVNDLEIYYPTKKIRAGTYGRGVWEASLYSELFGQPIADFTASPVATCSLGDTVTLTDLSEGQPTNWQWSIYPNTFAFVNGTSNTSQNPQVVFTALGDYAVTLTATNGYGQDFLVKSRAVSVGGKSLPFFEDFEQGELRNSWEVVNNDNDKTWQLVPVGGSNNGSRAARMAFYNYPVSGEEDALISPVLNFAGYTGIALTFEHAYRNYNATRNDSLKVYISTDCGTTYTLLSAFGENGTGIWATGTASTTSFAPATDADWCYSLNNSNCKSIDLNSYAGNTNVRIKFVAKGYNGNNLYLDNINISGTPTTKPTANFFGDTAGCSVSSFSFFDLSTKSPTAWFWSFPGGSPSTAATPNPTVTYATGGTYSVTLYATNAAGTDTVVKTAYVTVDQAVTPAVNLTSSNTSICQGQAITLTATATNAGTNPQFIWYRNSLFETFGSNTITVSNVQNGDAFTARVIADLDCIAQDSVLSNAVAISVTAAPNVTLSNFNQLCLNDSPITLTGGSPAGGTYSGTGVSNGVFDPAVAGVGGQVITYTYTDPTTGCSSQATRSITVNNPPPQPSISYSNFVLKANPISTSYTYQWFDGQGNAIQGATDTVYVPTAIGNYQVQITFINNCSNISVPYNVTSIGVNEFELDKGLSVFPNPANKTITLTIFGNNQRDAQIKVINAAGQVVMLQAETLAAGRHQMELNVADLRSGLYIIEVNDGNKVLSEKLTKL